MFMCYAGMNRCTGCHRPPPLLLIEISPWFFRTECNISDTFCVNFTSYIKLPLTDVDLLLSFGAAAGGSQFYDKFSYTTYYSG